MVVNNWGHILLQKRSLNKDVAPGKWDTSVGGHVAPGETIESELVYTHELYYEGPFKFNRHEIDEVRFWSIEKIMKSIGKGTLSANFEDEFARYISFRANRLIGMVPQ